IVVDQDAQVLLVDLGRRRLHQLGEEVDGGLGPEAADHADGEIPRRHAATIEQASPARQSQPSLSASSRKLDAPISTPSAGARSKFLAPRPNSSGLATKAVRMPWRFAASRSRLCAATIMHWSG